jgi:molybdopterin-binding protein
MRLNRSILAVDACSEVVAVPHMRIRDAAGFLGVSDDTVRRWIDNGSLASTTDDVGRMVIDGYELAKFARRQATTAPNPLGVSSSARNRFVGLVTDIRADKVMAQVELQCGPFRVVSLMSSEAVRDMKLELGSVAVAVVKSTTVIVETPEGES